MKKVSIGVMAAASLMALGACSNGSNNAADTTGMPNSSAAGSVGGATTPVTPDTMGAGATGTPIDTALKADSAKDARKSKPKKP